jgi:hypothetical protein
MHIEVQIRFVGVDIDLVERFHQVEVTLKGGHQRRDIFLREGYAG